MTSYSWRKLSSSKWEDVWMDRLAGFAERLAITALAGSASIRLEIFQLRRPEAQELKKRFGGQIIEQKRERALIETKPRPPIRVRDKLVIVSTAAERDRLPASWKR